jgi:hypothetical protein
VIVDDVVRRLYVRPPEEFVAARSEAVGAAQDPARAAEIGKLRRPTVAAWLVNLLAIERPELLADLAELSGALRAAQRELHGAQLKELSGQRRATVAALVAEARRLAIEAKPALAGGNLPLAEVEATLQAALADAQAADLVRSGQLVRAIEYAGFGEVPRPQLRLITGGSTVDNDTGRELTAARTAENEARTALDAAIKAEDDGAAALADAEAALGEAQRRRAAADEELSQRKLARKAAERLLAAARRRVGDAEAMLG